MTGGAVQLALFLYLAGAVVELITRGVSQDVFRDRRRKRAIDELRDLGTPEETHRLEHLFAPGATLGA